MSGQKTELGSQRSQNNQLRKSSPVIRGGGGLQEVKFLALVLKN